MRLKACITALHAALLCILLAASPAGSGSMTLLGVGKAVGGGGGSPAYVYQGNNLFSSGAGATQTFAITTGSVAAGALVVATIGVNGAPFTITSVTYDPTGANVVLTQDAFNNSASTSAVYSGVVAGAISSGSKNIVVVFSGNTQFQDVSANLWTMTGLGSNLKQTSAAGSGVNLAIGVTAGHFLIAGAGGAGATSDYSTSTETPAATHNPTLTVTAADWTIVATNASFSILPSAGHVTSIAAATYH